MILKFCQTFQIPISKTIYVVSHFAQAELQHIENPHFVKQHTLNEIVCSGQATLFVIQKLFMILRHNGFRESLKKRSQDKEKERMLREHG